MLWFFYIENQFVIANCARMVEFCKMESEMFKINEKAKFTRKSLRFLKNDKKIVLFLTFCVI